MALLDAPSYKGHIQVPLTFETIVATNAGIMTEHGTPSKTEVILSSLVTYDRNDLLELYRRYY